MTVTTDPAGPRTYPALRAAWSPLSALSLAFYVGWFVVAPPHYPDTSPLWFRIGRVVAPVTFAEPAVICTFPSALVAESSKTSSTT